MEPTLTAAEAPLEVRPNTLLRRRLVSVALLIAPIAAAAVLALLVTGEVVSAALPILLGGALGSMGVAMAMARERRRAEERERAADLARVQEALRQNETQLAHAEKLSTLGTLVASVAHELNQPFTCMTGYLYLLSTRLSASTQDPEALATISRQVETMRQAAVRMSKIIDHLRSYGRLAARVATRTPLNDVIDGALLLIQADQQFQAIPLVVDLARESPVVLADPSELEQVLLNLLTNARDAVGDRPGGQIWLRTRAEGDRGILEVRDNGPGVPAELRTQIFAPFFTTKPNSRGTGLGLAVSREIVHRYHGEISVTAAPEGGACFEVGFALASPGAIKEA
jgi:C4-dicarboxylate-specific signal transduction histidine kinase